MILENVLSKIRSTFTSSAAKAALLERADSQAARALSLKDSGKTGEALKLLRNAEKAFRVAGRQEGVADVLGDQAAVLEDDCQYNAALALLLKEELVRRETGDLQGVAGCLLVQAEVMEKSGRPAAGRFENAKDAFAQLGENRRAAECLGHQARCLGNSGKSALAMTLYKRQEVLYREMKDDKGLAGSLGGQAQILIYQNRLPEAMTICREEERLCREVNDNVGLTESLRKQAFLWALGDKRREGIKLLKEALRIAETDNNEPKALEISTYLEAMNHGRFEGHERLRASAGLKDLKVLRAFNYSKRKSRSSEKRGLGTGA